MEEQIIIAIDGPSASGKSTVARAVAKQLGLLYVDSGALYRGVTWQALRCGVDLDDPKALMDSVRSAEWTFHEEGGAVVFSINGNRPGQELRSKEVREAVAAVATIPEVRAFVFENLRAHARMGSLVIEGRDIGSAVFPGIPRKFYLDADAEERTRRRCHQLAAAGEHEEAGAVMESLKKRDQIDSTRRNNPLVTMPEATVIDSTNMELDEVIEVVINRVSGVL